MKAVTPHINMRLPAEDISKSSAGDEKNGISQPVACDDQLHLGKRGMQAGADRRDGDIHNEEIERGEEGAGKDDRQRLPSPWIGSGRRQPEALTGPVVAAETFIFPLGAGTYRVWHILHG